MGIIASILIWGGIAALGLLAVGLIFFLGVVIGRAQVKPKSGYVGFSTIIKRDVYNELLDKGAYKTEQHMMQDALTLLNWGLDNAGQGRYVGSCDQDGGNLAELPLDTFLALRAAFNPRNHLERCLGLMFDKKEEDNEN